MAGLIVTRFTWDCCALTFSRVAQNGLAAASLACLRQTSALFSFRGGLVVLS